MCGRFTQYQVSQITWPSEHRAGRDQRVRQRAHCPLQRGAEYYGAHAP
jgi:hypothetical protein